MKASTSNLNTSFFKTKTGKILLIFFILSFIAFVFSLLALIYHREDIANKEQSNLWSKVFRLNTSNGWDAYLKIFLKEKVFIGKQYLWSNDKDQSRYLFLNQAWVLTKNKKYKKISGPGVLLPEREITHIVFISKNEFQKITNTTISKK